MATLDRAEARLLSGVDSGPDDTTRAGYHINISTADHDPRWDNFLTSTPGGYHVQSSLWAQVKAPLGWRAARVIVTCSAQLVGGAQVLLRRLPLVGSIGYVPRGPVLAEDDPHLSTAIVGGLHRIARAYRVQYLVVQPTVAAKTLDARLVADGFRSSPFAVAPTATIIVDLTDGPDAVLARMRKKTRQHIRHGLRGDLSVREGDERDLPTFYRLLEAASRRRGYRPYPREYFLKLWSVFSPGGHARLFVAERGDEAVTALLVIPFGDRVLTKSIGWSGEHGESRPNELVYWRAIEWAAAHGYRFCDLEGIDRAAAEGLARGEPLPESLKQTPTFFKLGFGGEVTLLPKAYDYVYHPLLRRTYGAVSRAAPTLPIVRKLEEVIRGASRD